MGEVEDKDKLHLDIQRFIDDLFNNSYFIGCIELDMPNASYQGIVKVLSEHEELFRERNLQIAFIKKELGYHLIIDRTKRRL